MSSEHGTTAQWLRNFVRSRIPWVPRLAMTARNLRLRLGPPPQDCCGHLGEPGC